MRRREGRIMAMIGNSYYENWPDFIPHTLAKVGLAKLMQSLAVTLSPYIQCNAICPAVIYPSAAGQDQHILRSRGESHAGEYEKLRGEALFHRGTPEEVGELVVYLAGCSGYLTGAVIPIDGGKSAL